MRYRLYLAPLLAALVIYFGTACGTVVNLSEGKACCKFGFPNQNVPFGGVGNSMMTGALAHGTGMVSVWEGKPGLALLGSAGGWYAWLIDAPMSAAGDAITLPIVVGRNIRNLLTPEEAEAPIVAAEEEATVDTPSGVKLGTPK